MKVAKAYFWPRWFYDSLPVEKQKNIPKNLVIKLQRANLYLWQALNIYDDFLDGNGQAQKLPDANNHFRKFLEIYYRQNFPSDYYYLFNQVLTDLEAANRQEVLGLTARDYQTISLKNLSRKSLALGLGPLALLSYSGYRIDDSRCQTTLNFFRYALAAKQLSDDARDWAEDLNANKITIVNSPINKFLLASHLKYQTLDQCPEANLFFARRVAPRLIKNLAKLISLARREAQRAGWSPANRLADALLAPLETGVSETTYFLKLLRQKT